MSVAYADFLERKTRRSWHHGIDVASDAVHPKLYEWQRRIVAWAAERGRCAIFADCGLGKTFMQLEWARPVWSDIRETDTLNTAVAREDADERHIAPLQLPLIERAVRLWSNRGESVLSPFAGIGSEGVVSVKRGRRFVGCELKASYWRTAVRNLERAEREVDLPQMFAEVAP